MNGDEWLTFSLKYPAAGGSLRVLLLCTGFADEPEIHKNRTKRMKSRLTSDRNERKLFHDDMKSSFATKYLFADSKT